MKEKGFTLAETMIVLVVLGVIAVVTVPALVNKHIESTNRTKVKKAMTVYDTALNKMVIENGIKDNAALYESANSFAPEGNCTNTAPYFKVSTTLNNNPCTFKAPDGLFWNISKINAPIIAFSEADLNNEDAQNRYQLVGHFDNNGSLRVDDLAFETGDNKTALQKTYNYINAVKEEDSSDLSCDDTCKQIKQYSQKECENMTSSYPGTEYSSDGCTNCKSCKVIDRNNGNSTMIYDENGKNFMVGYGCDSTGEKCQNMEGGYGYRTGYDYQYECTRNEDGYYYFSECVKVPYVHYASGSGSGYYSSSYYSSSGYGS